MLTPQQEELLKITEKYEALRKEMKELKPKMQGLLTEIGVGTYFQDPRTNCVFKIVEPQGTFISFDKISYDRTKKEDEKRGSLSKKEAQEAGFEL